ncbi:MAG: hypothetical protein ACRDYF_01470 [Acidimicrobiia bacterium]
MEAYPEFDMWRAELGRGSPSPDTPDEASLARAARWIFENEWSTAAPRRCARCGQDCHFRDVDGNCIHPTCVDNPPDPFWLGEEPAPPALSPDEFEEIITRARFGYRVAPEGEVCVICRQPCDCTDPAGLVRHALCRL